MKKKHGIILAFAIITLLYLFQGLDRDTFSFFIGGRVSKLFLMIIIGITVGVSSSVFQTLTNNRILTPGILGIDTIYLFFNILLVYFVENIEFLISKSYLHFFIVATFTIVASTILYKVIFGKEHRPIGTIILIGVIFGTLLKSLSSFLQIMLDPNQFSLVQDMSFASINNADLTLIYVTAPILLIICVIVGRKFHLLDVLALGREQSINLGVEYEKKVKFLFFIVVVLTAISTALIGPLTFFGVAVINIAREFVKTYKHKELITYTCLLGVFFLLVAQFLLERVFDMAVPIGVVISSFSGLYFIILMKKESKNV